MPHPIEILVGQKIKQARQHAGFTQEELALKLDCLQVEIARWETAKRVPRIAVLIRIAEALSVPMCFFFEE